MRKGLQSLDFSFEAESLTHFGGLFLIQRFCNKLCLRRRLERILRRRSPLARLRPGGFDSGVSVCSDRWTAAGEQDDILQYNGLFLSLVGLKKFPDETALRRFLHRLSPPNHSADRTLA